MGSSRPIIAVQKHVVIKPFETVSGEKQQQFADRLLSAESLASRQPHHNECTQKTRTRVHTHKLYPN